jgi:hypothetical protein
MKNPFKFLFEGKYQPNRIDKSAFIEYVKNPKHFRTFFLGIGESANGFVTKDPVEEPGIGIVGSMGSGKSITGRGIVDTLQLTSGEATFFAMIDMSDKAMGDYNKVLNLDNAAAAVRDKRKLFSMFYMIENEMNARGHKFFTLWSSNNVYTYEKNLEIYRQAFNEHLYPKLSSESLDLKSLEGEELYVYKDNQSEKMHYSKSRPDTTKNTILVESNLLELFNIQIDANVLEWDEDIHDSFKDIKKGRSVHSESIERMRNLEPLPPVALFVVVMEEFHAIINSDEMSFIDNKDRVGTIANILKRVAKEGRSAMMDLIIITQSASSAEIPTDLKAGLLNPLSHRVTNASLSSGFNLEVAAELGPIKGRGYSREGLFQFPFITDELFYKLNKDVPKFRGMLLSHKANEYKEAMASEGLEYLINNFPFEGVLNNSKIFLEDIPFMAKRLINYFGFETEEIPNASFDINGICSRGGEYYAYITLKPRMKASSFFEEKTFDYKKLVNQAQSYVREMHADKDITIKGLVSVSFQDISPLKRNTTPKGEEASNFFDLRLDDLLTHARFIDNEKENRKENFYNSLYKDLVLADPEVLDQIKKEENPSGSLADDLIKGSSESSEEDQIENKEEGEAPKLDF